MPPAPSWRISAKCLSPLGFRLWVSPVLCSSAVHLACLRVLAVADSWVNTSKQERNDMNDPFREPCPEPYPACVLSRFRWDRSSVMVHPSGTVPHTGLPCLCTPALLQVSSDEGGMLSTRLAWGPWVPPGAGGSGGRAGWARARLALPVMSPICELSQEHSPPSRRHLAVGMEFTSPALSLLPPDAAGCPGLGVESPQALAPQQPRQSHPFT